MSFNILYIYTHIKRHCIFSSTQPNSSFIVLLFGACLSLHICNLLFSLNWNQIPFWMNKVVLYEKLELFCFHIGCLGCNERFGYSPTCTSLTHIVYTILSQLNMFVPQYCALFWYPVFTRNIQIQLLLYIREFYCCLIQCEYIVCHPSLSGKVFIPDNLYTSTTATPHINRLKGLVVSLHGR